MILMILSTELPSALIKLSTDQTLSRKSKIIKMKKLLSSYPKCYEKIEILENEVDKKEQKICRLQM